MSVFVKIKGSMYQMHLNGRKIPGYINMRDITVEFYAVSCDEN